MPPEGLSLTLPGRRHLHKLGERAPAVPFPEKDFRPPVGEHTTRFALLAAHKRYIKTLVPPARRRPGSPSPGPPDPCVRPDGLARASAGSRSNLQHAHHLVILMREDVAVPDVAARLVEGCILINVTSSGHAVTMSLGAVFEVLLPAGRSTRVAPKVGFADLEAVAPSPRSVVELCWMTGCLEISRYRVLELVPLSSPGLETSKCDKMQCTGCASPVDLPQSSHSSVVTERRVLGRRAVPGDGAFHLADQTSRLVDGWSLPAS